MTRRRLTLWICGLLLLTAVPVLAQMRDFGRTTIRVPDPVTAGEWTGTWVFENRLRKVAMWLREGDDGLEVRIKQFMLTDAETFFTDWDGTASYAYRNIDGEVTIRFEESDETRARGSWLWRSAREAETVTETGRFTMFRAEDGRYAVIRFDELEILREFGDSAKTQTPPRVWTFRKASRRHAAWDELAF